MGYLETMRSVIKDPMVRLPNPLKILLLMIACLAPQKILAEQVDTASIRKILGTENLPHPDPMDDETSKKQLDSIANYETTRLAPGNQNWNVSSLKWKPVYDRIRADLESELLTSIAARQANPLKMGQYYEADIASHLSQSDVDSILTYYSTPEGQRYQDFIRKIDEIWHSGVGSLRAKEDVQSTAAQPADLQSTAVELAPEQMKQYGRMLLLSHPAQSTMAQVRIAEAAGGDTSGSTVIGICAIEAINKSPQELEALSREYGNDLSGFEAFSGTGAAQHFFVAMEQATMHFIKTLSDSIKAVEQKHASEWKALYLAQIGDPPSAEVPGKSENSPPSVEPPRG